MQTPAHRQRRHFGQFVLLDLESSRAFAFTYFPRAVSQTFRANFEAQDVIGGVKPLAYGNREPQRIRVEEVYLDRSDTSESISEDIDALRGLTEEGRRGAPPALLARWGDRSERVVLEEVEIETVMFLPQGEPTRARVRLSLVGVQDGIAETTSTVVDSGDVGAAASAASASGQTTGGVRLGPIP